LTPTSILELVRFPIIILFIPHTLPLFSSLLLLFHSCKHIRDVVSAHLLRVPGLLLDLVNELPHVPREHIHLRLLVIDHVLYGLPLDLDDVLILQLLPVQLREVSVHHVAVRLELRQRGEEPWRGVLLRHEL
jgi:hypothetical protein